MHPLKKYLLDVRESVPEFGARVGASRQTLYRIINGQQSPKPALARRVVEATGNAVTLNDLFGAADGSGAAIVSLPPAEDAGLDLRRLKIALSIVLNHLSVNENAAPPDHAVEIAAEAAANTYLALAPVTTRHGPARLTQALRPVLEEILREYAGSPPPPGALDRGAELATDLYYQAPRFSPSTDEPR